MTPEEAKDDDTRADPMKKKYAEALGLTARQLRIDNRASHGIGEEMREQGLIIAIRIVILSRLKMPL